jgi:hypothetical protein
MEFYQFEVTDGTISLADFGKSIVSHSSPRIITKLLDRADRFERTDERISFEQFVNFDKMIRTKLHELGVLNGIGIEHCRF